MGAVKFKCCSPVCGSIIIQTNLESLRGLQEKSINICLLVAFDMLL